MRKKKEKKKKGKVKHRLKKRKRKYKYSISNRDGIKGTQNRKPKKGQTKQNKCEAM